MDDPAAFPPPLRARYRPLRRLGSGGFAAVFEVVAPGGARRALKVFAPGADPARVARERLAGEARHPGLLETFGGGVIGGVSYLELELADGGLRDLYRAAAAGDRSAFERAWAALDEVAAAVDFLRGLGQAHRDLKPENVLFVGGRAKLADFGLARGGDLRTLTATGHFYGTPAYMAPEQARGLGWGPEVDVFAWGTMVVELCAGRIPWDRGGAAATLSAIAAGDAAVPRGLRAALGEDRGAWLAACLAAEPGGRPTTLEGGLGATPAAGPAPRAAGAATVRLPGEPGALTRAVGRSPGAGASRRGRTTGPRGAAARRRRAVTGAALGAVLGGVVLGYSRGRRADPAAPVPPAPATTPGFPAEGPGAPADDAGGPGALRPAPAPFDLARLKEEFSDLPELFLSNEGRVIPIDRRTGKEPCLCDPDPALWGEVLESLPTLDRALVALRRDPPQRALAAETRRAYAAADDFLVSRGFWAAFGPELDPPPAAVPDAVAAARAEMDALRRLHAARVAEVEAAARDPRGWRADPALQSWLLADQRTGGRVREAFLSYGRLWRLPPVRLAMARRWPESDPVTRRLFRFLRRAVAEDDPRLGELGSELRGLFFEARAAPLTAAADERYTRLFPGADRALERPDAAMALVPILNAQLHMKVAGEWRDDPAQRAALRRGLEAAMRVDPARPLAAQAARFGAAVSWWAGRRADAGEVDAIWGFLYPPAAPPRPIGAGGLFRIVRGKFAEVPVTAPLPTDPAARAALVEDLRRSRAEGYFDGDSAEGAPWRLRVFLERLEAE